MVEHMIATLEPPKPRTLADLVRDLGDIPLNRIRYVPSPGTATIADAAAVKGCELVEGVLVEKAMGLRESILAMHIGWILRSFVGERNLGIITGEQGMMAILPDLVRMPDVAFISWERFPNRRIPEEPVPELAPDLAVEILSANNTAKEMARKRHEYFTAGVKLVWIVDPTKRTIQVFNSETDFRTLTGADTLDGGTVLPDFGVAVAAIFGKLDDHG